MKKINPELQNLFVTAQGNEELRVAGKTYTGRIVIPNDQELTYLKGADFGQYLKTPFAVRVRQFGNYDLMTLRPGIAKKERDDFQGICNAHKNHKFLFHYQFPNGVLLTGEQVAVMHDSQEIDETPFFLAYTAFNWSLEVAKAQLRKQVERHTNKIVLPVFDLDVKDLKSLAERALYVVEVGFKHCVVICRGYKNMAWSILMPILKRAGIFVFVLGVQPRMTRDDKKATLLAYPFLYGANCVSHGLSWWKGQAAIQFLGKDWIYRQNSALESGDRQLDYAVSRIQAIETANESCMQELQGRTPIELVQTIEGFRYFGERMGMLYEG